MTDLGGPASGARGADILTSLLCGLLSELFSAYGVISFRTSHFVYRTIPHGDPMIAALNSATRPIIVGYVLALGSLWAARSLGGIIRWLPLIFALGFSGYLVVLVATHH